MNFTLQTTLQGIEDIVLRSPEYGNTETIAIGMEIRRTRGDVIRVARDADAWPRVFNYTYDFIAVTNITKCGADPPLAESDPLYMLVKRMRIFFQLTAGLPITIIDHLGDSFTAFIESIILPIKTVMDTTDFRFGFTTMVVEVPEP